MEGDCNKQGVVQVEVHDVEEGEISDSASVEEITEEVFNNNQAPPPPSPAPVKIAADSNNSNLKNNGGAGSGTRAWTMRDVYKYQVGSRNSYSGLYNLAWAQAVNNKPLDEVFVMMEDKSSKDNTSDGNNDASNAKNSNVNDSTVVSDVEDEGDKEEGELEEGEIDLDSDVIVGNEGLTVEVEENKDVERRKRIALIKKELQFLNVADAEKSFDRLCSSLKNSADNLSKLVAEGPFTERENLVQMLSTAIQDIKSVFSSMNRRLKECNRDVLWRLLAHVTTVKPPLFSSHQLKEMEIILSSMGYSAGSSRNDKKSTKKHLHEGFNRTDSNTLFEHSNKDLNCLSKGEMESWPTGSFDQTEHGVGVESLRSGLNSSKHKGLALPLLDLHKDHDLDSLPSPTRELSAPLPFDKGFVLGQGLVKPEWPVPRRALGRENSMLHPYETDAVKAVSSYQQKFGQGPFYMNNELPSPTPSEEGDAGDCEMGGEVSSSIASSFGSAVNASSIGQPVASIMNSLITRKSVVPHSADMVATTGQGFSNHGIVGPASTNPNPVLRSSSARSRDPRLRLANSVAGSRNVNQGLPSVEINEPKQESLGIMSAKKQKTLAELVLDGPAPKRQRNESTGSGVVYDKQVVTGTGGWLEDRGTVSIPVTSGNHILGSVVNGSRNLEHAVNRASTCYTVPNSIAHGNENFPIVGQNTTLQVSGPTTTLPLSSATSTSLMASTSTILPVCSPFTLPLTSQSTNLPAKDSNATTSIDSLIRNIAVNPSVWMNILKMEHERSSDISKIMKQTPNSNFVLGAVPSTNGALPNSSMLGQVSAGIVQTPSPAVPVDESGKVRMKPRDPRRFLHNIVPQKAATVGSDQAKVNALFSSPLPGNLGAPRQEDQLENQLVTSSTMKPPDITRQFTNNLKNIADILSVSQVSTPVPSVPQISTSQHVPDHQDGTGTKAVLAESGNLRNGTGLALEEANADPPRPLNANAWSNVEHLFEGFDDQQKAAIQRERARRLEEQKKMFVTRKLCLVLDLDHTLLNSAKFVEVDPLHDDMLRKKEEQEREKPYKHLFRFPHMGMWTKLRPGIWNFLEKASKLFEMHLYTMGNKYYATEMAKLLDPTGDLFSGRVLSRGDDGEPFDGDERVPKSKDLEGVLGLESAVVIMDDSVRVWPHNKHNLIVVERYIYFPCSRRQFGLPGPSLLEIDHDERPEEGTLASSLSVIERIHQNFFAHQSLDEADVRNILASEQQKILGGCRIVFSRVFPVGEAKPHMHPLWQTAEQFGAVCTNQIDEQVTHVVANSLGTDKVNWALSKGRFVVHPGWVEASALLYRRANEHDFAIKSQ